MASYLVILSADNEVLATVKDYSTGGVTDLAGWFARKLKARVSILAIRENAFHTPLTLGETFDPSNPGARIVDQDWGKVGADYKPL